MKYQWYPGGSKDCREKAAWKMYDKEDYFYANICHVHIGEARKQFPDYVFKRSKGRKGVKP